MPNIPGADARQSRTLQKLSRFTPEGVTAKAADAHELIEKKLAHLDAMLMMTWGCGGAIFGQLLDESAKDNYLWACSELASEIRQLFGLMRMRP